ncbi:MAG: hypothetical protein HY660_06875 [Armatimonadetes bacterium]|nr:hypothetical protein [Armatimonadota bacterium]
MKLRTRGQRSVHICTIASFAWPGFVYAYVDPTAGGVLLQLALGGIAGIMALLKLFGATFRQRLSERLSRR